MVPTPSRLSHLECARCGRSHDAAALQQRCECGGTLLARYDVAGLDLDSIRRREPGMWRYRELLPVAGEPASLGEVETPLLLMPRLSARWGTEVWLKDDGILPTGTFKARGAVMGLSRAAELGVRDVVMPTAGNAGAAWALYAARSGITLTVVMARTAPASNRAEAEVAGAEVELVDGSIADAGARAKEIAAERGAFFAGTFYEPFRVEGKKTAWLETYDRMGSDTGEVRFPKTIVTPVGGGVAAVSAMKAATEVTGAGWTGDALPKIVGVQAQDCAPIVRAFDEGRDDVPAWTEPSTTIAAGLRVPAPGEGPLVLKTVRDSGGTMLAVAERDIRLAVRHLAATEGVFACPEGAATMAAADRLARDGALEGPVVLYNTGAGIKYLDAL